MPTINLKKIDFIILKCDLSGVGPGEEPGGALAPAEIWLASDVPLYVSGL